MRKHFVLTVDCLADARPRSANKSPLNRPTSAAYYRPRSAARPSSTGSIRPPSAATRPSTDPVKSELLGKIIDHQIKSLIFLLNFRC